MVKEVLLKDYNPVNTLTVKQTNVTKPKFPVYDFHVHLGPLTGSQFNGDISSIVQGLKDVGICGVTSLKLAWGDDFMKYFKLFEGYEDFINIFGSLDIGRMEDIDFAAYADETFKQYKSMGIRGLKFWKDIGLYRRDKSGKFFPVDDDRLRPMWEAAAKYDLITLIHIADPKSFFEPVDERNESYCTLLAHPKWSFYGPEFYSFEQMMEQQEGLLAKNPDTTFVIPHMGSYGENLGFVGSQLDRHQNMHIDISARLVMLGRQPYSAREFLIKYQDRVLFGTDYGGGNAADFHPGHYRVLETFDECIQPYENAWGKVSHDVHGVGLPDEVLRKIYSENAYKLLNIKRNNL